MNYIKHLTGFFETVSKDQRLNPTHISLYIALFQHWNINRFVSPVSIARSEVMRISKISAKGTYHKCIKDLHNFGYINYVPSYNPFKGSFVYLFNFQTSNEQALTRHRTKNETSIEQALIPSINNINISNNKTFVNETPGQTANSNFDTAVDSKEKSCAKKANSATVLRESIPPNIPDILEYFDHKQWPQVEAEKFYNYFQSNGWLIGGKAPMKDWKAAARNWMLNTKKFNSESTPTSHNAGKLNATTNKDYSEPL